MPLLKIKVLVLCLSRSSDHVCLHLDDALCKFAKWVGKLVVSWVVGAKVVKELSNANLFWVLWCLTLELVVALKRGYEECHKQRMEGEQNLV